jgi:hypothetical protein
MISLIEAKVKHETGLDADLTACGDERPAERRASFFPNR